MGWLSFLSTLWAPLFDDKAENHPDDYDDDDDSTDCHAHNPKITGLLRDRASTVPSIIS